MVLTLVPVLVAVQTSVMVLVADLALVSITCQLERMLMFSIPKILFDFLTRITPSVTGSGCDTYDEFTLSSKSERFHTYHCQ